MIPDSEWAYFSKNCVFSRKRRVRLSLLVPRSSRAALIGLPMALPRARPSVNSSVPRRTGRRSRQPTRGAGARPRPRTRGRVEPRGALAMSHLPRGKALLPRVIARGAWRARAEHGELRPLLRPHERFIFDSVFTRLTQPADERGYRGGAAWGPQIHGGPRFSSASRYMFH